MSKSDALEGCKAIQPLVGLEVGQITLYVVSKKQSCLKGLKLEHLTVEERRTKLTRWAEEKRFAAVVELDDEVVAHVCADFVDKLQQVESLSIGNKKVTVQALTPEASEILSLASEALLLEEGGDLTVAAEEERPKGAAFASPSNLMSELSVVHRGVSPQVYAQCLVACIKNQKGKLLTDCLKQWNEEAREERKRAEAQDKRERILREEIEKGIRKEEIIREEIELLSN